MLHHQTIYFYSTVDHHPITVNWSDTNSVTPSRHLSIRSLSFHTSTYIRTHSNIRVIALNDVIQSSSASSEQSCVLEEDLHCILFLCFSITLIPNCEEKGYIFRLNERYYNEGQLLYSCRVIFNKIYKLSRNIILATSWRIFDMVSNVSQHNRHCVDVIVSCWIIKHRFNDSNYNSSRDATHYNI